MKESYIKGINNVIKSQKELNPSIRFSMFKFNSVSGTDIRCLNVPITDVDFLKSDDFNPNGATPLYDAILTMYKLKQNKPCIVIIMTDGCDNASVANQNTIIKCIEHMKANNCSFLYLGDSERANMEGRNIGIENCIIYDKTSTSIEKASYAINIAISQACFQHGGTHSNWVTQHIPSDVRDLTDIFGVWGI
jgi:hypothetical protein